MATDQAQISNDMLQYWKDDDTFAKSIQEKSKKLTYTFYDGPPFASGDPHYGHLLASSIKDTVARYMTMRGYRVDRIRGWDCHGMPAESYVEKKLGLSGKKDIEALGVEKFVEACRESVRQVNSNRGRFIDHIGRWVDIEHAYYTMDGDFMESVMSCFAKMYHQNLIYKGFKIQGYCPSCATGLSNRDILEGYQMRNDPTAIVKFPVTQESPQSSDYKREQDGEHFARELDGSVQLVICVIRDEQNRILSFYNSLHNKRQFVSGHVDHGETIQEAALREVKEELGVDATITGVMGSLKKIGSTGNFATHYYVNMKLIGEARNMEPHKHSQMEYIQILESDNVWGCAYQVKNLIIEDEHDVAMFGDLCGYHILTQHSDRIHNPQASLNFLAWTTTPWTLPSNMFLAVGGEISYALVYDLTHQEYYILARDLLDTLYHDQSEYILIALRPGKSFKGIKYQPLFDYYHQADIPQSYKDQVHQVLLGDFVSTSDGVGIVHIAPAFGEDDYQLSAQVLTKEKVEEWLFMPINQYGEFGAEVPDFVGLKVHDANKTIIEHLKVQNRVYKVDQISHSYPHCWRCDTPLIYRAITSRFVSETKLASDNIKQAQDLNFVPESVKHRFINGLEQAPDWNISRNRYRGCPLPVREADNSNQTALTEGDRIVVGSLEQLYQLTRTGSRNITKITFVRHGQTDYNLRQTPSGYIHDSYGKAILSEKGQMQADHLMETLAYQSDQYIYLSPLPRVIQTAQPWITQHKGIDIMSLETYQQAYTLYQQYWNEGRLTDMAILDQSVYEIYPHIYIDFRLGEEYFKDYQDQLLKFDQVRRNDDPIGSGASVIFNFEKTKSFLNYISQQHPGADIVVFAHGNNGLMLHKCVDNFDHDTHMLEYTPSNAQPITYYYDHDRQASVDLHLPYIDRYRFIQDGVTYRRVAEVLDCWFESGAMPFGQFHKIQDLQSQTLSDFPQYPADFIAEGLDQTRGRFRTLHIVGNALRSSNSFRNVIVNGLILAQDGKKMSKKLKNYPDPKELLTNYGADAFRLYTLGSPVVRSEPLRFEEKAVLQMLKDVIMPLHNVVNFFKMYADIDHYQHDGTELFFMRHAKCVQGDIVDRPLSDLGFAQLQSQEFKEALIAIDPDIIISSDTTRTNQTALGCQTVLSEYCNKEVAVIKDRRFAEGKLRSYMQHNDMDACITELDGMSASIQDGLKSIYESYKGKKVLIVGHNVTLYALQSVIFRKSFADMHDQTIADVITLKSIYSIDPAVCVKLPSYQIHNELDQHILAELHQTIATVNQSLTNYRLDDAVRSAIGFVDVLSNRYVRRSRRRFWGSGLEGDKLSAYHTLYEVLTTYLKLMAPIIPFNTEYLWQILHSYQADIPLRSVHLQAYPRVSHIYINTELLEEIHKVRKIISMTLYLRAKNQLKIKQPLPQIEVSM